MYVGFCHVWSGVVFYLVSVGLHFAQLILSQEELVLEKTLPGFSVISVCGKERMTHITVGMKQ